MLVVFLISWFVSLVFNLTCSINLFLFYAFLLLFAVGITILPFSLFACLLIGTAWVHVYLFECHHLQSFYLLTIFKSSFEDWGHPVSSSNIYWVHFLFFLFWLRNDRINTLLVMPGVIEVRNYQFWPEFKASLFN